MALRTKDYNGYGTYNRAYNHLSSNDPNIQRDYDNGVLNSQFLRNQSQFIQNVNADPWATVGTLLGAVAANMKRDYDERGAQKTSEGIFNSLGLAEQQPTQYTQNGQAISMDNPNGEVQQQPSVLDQLSQGVTIGNQVVQGIAQDRKNSIIENAMNKWGADPNANQTAIALQDATDGVNANFVLGTGPTRSQMINTAIERGRQAGLNQHQLDALSKRVGEAYDARYDKDLKQYNQDMSGQVSAALQNRDYNKVSGLLTDMTAINPTLATSLGNIAKIRMDNDIKQQTINNAIDTAARRWGVKTIEEDQDYVGGREAVTDAQAKAAQKILESLDATPEMKEQAKDILTRYFSPSQGAQAPRVARANKASLNNYVTGLLANVGQINPVTKKPYTVEDMRQVYKQDMVGAKNRQLMEDVWAERTKGLQQQTPNQETKPKEQSWLEKIGADNEAAVEAANQSDYLRSGSSGSVPGREVNKFVNNAWFYNPNKKK